MIKIKNLTKTYQPKKGLPVNAVNDLSVVIGEKGLVFMLGKSGSGKSTLLNLIGGLDKYDNGDIIIKGKSTKDFTQSNFDSYRNSYVGFIFQEYNILDELSVGANIGLAIELQGRKSTNEQVNRILKQLDLEGYGERKPNELSGGQKQRVAIARALVKDPDIILADEPTGALDSETGKQLLETLKHLSKDKLVLVVSHDRETAFKYGDRVIELADGKIINDVMKTGPEASGQSFNTKLTNDHELLVSENYELTEEDFRLINQYIKKNKKLTLIAKNYISSTDSPQQTEFVTTKEVAETKYQDEDFKLVKSKLPNKMAFRMGTSNLTHKKIRLLITILLSLVSFTLFAVSDTLASYNEVNAITNSIIDSNVNYASFTKTIETKIERDTYSYTQEEKRKLDDNEVKKLEESTGLNFIPVYYEGPLYQSTNISQNFSDILNTSYYYNGTISGAISLSANDISTLGFELTGNLPSNNNEVVITKHLFEHFQEYGYYFFEQRIGQQETIRIEGSEIKNENDMIGKKINYRFSYDSNEEIYTIVGILDTNFDGERYEELKLPSRNYFLESEYERISKYSYHSLLVFNDDLLTTKINQTNDMINLSGEVYYRIDSPVANEEYIGLGIDVAHNFQDFNKNDYVFFDENKTTLNDNEMIIDYTSYLDTFGNVIKVGTEEYHLRDYENFTVEERVLKYAKDNYLTARDNGFYNSGNHWGEAVKHLLEEDEIFINELNDINRGVNDLINIITIPNEYLELIPSVGDLKKNQEYIDKYRFFIAEVKTNVIVQEENQHDFNYWIEEIEKRILHMEFLADNYEIYKISQLFNAYYMYLMNETRYLEINIYGDKTYLDIKKEVFDEEISPILLNSNPIIMDSILQTNLYGETKDRITIVGVFYKDKRDDYLSEIIISNSEYEYINTLRDSGYYRYVIAQMPKNRNEIKQVAQFSTENFGNTTFDLQNQITPTLEIANSIVEQSAKIALYVGIGFAVFAGLMLSNFIGTSISRQKREIGILRALGARSNDVFKIFFSESIAIAIINFFVSSVISAIVIIYINKTLRDQAGLQITIFDYGIRQVALLLLISVIVALVASYLPVSRIARKKPVDAISNK